MTTQPSPDHPDIVSELREASAEDAKVCMAQNEHDICDFCSDASLKAAAADRIDTLEAEVASLRSDRERLATKDPDLRTVLAFEAGMAEAEIQMKGRVEELLSVIAAAHETLRSKMSYRQGAPGGFHVEDAAGAVIVADGFLAAALQEEEADG